MDKFLENRLVLKSIELALVLAIIMYFTFLGDAIIKNRNDIKELKTELKIQDENKFKLFL